MSCAITSIAYICTFAEGAAKDRVSTKAAFVYTEEESVDALRARSCVCAGLAVVNAGLAGEVSWSEEIFIGA